MLKNTFKYNQIKTYNEMKIDPFSRSYDLTDSVLGTLFSLENSLFIQLSPH